MSVALVFDVSALDHIAQRIRALSDLDRESLLDDLGAEVESQTRRRLSEEKTAPDGEPWQSLTETYQQRKAEKSSGELLEFHGDLIDSIHYTVQGDQVEIGSNLVYAAHINFGGEDIGTAMPRRQYLGFSDDNQQDLQGVVDDFLGRHVEAVQ